MIQRIQTIYLLIVAALVAVTLFMPLATFSSADTQLVLRAFDVQTAAGESVQPTLYLGILLSLACVVPLVTIFLFKRRLLQIRLCVVEIVLLIGCAVMEGVYYYLTNRAFEAAVDPQSVMLAGPKPAIALPVICLLFAYLALRAIFRDEMLVRAADRIR